ncbi:hypothetical protein N431DRAFT_447627 [Stipitochalara longipes BDJ]|nr:hypothetical protein N431DRAFT_447627 [Stipitochalara longipes BDJ]
MEQQQHHGRVQDNQDQRAQHQAQHRQQGGQQEPSQRRNRVEAPERLFVTVMSNVTYKYIPRTFGILFITAGTLVLTYTFMNRILPRKAAWGMVGLFAGVCVFRLLGMICLFLDKNCEEKKAWSKRASRASIDLEGGLGSPSCPHRCADRVEGAWDWVKECFYQGLCFGFCFPCASKKKMKKRRDSRSQGSRSGGRELEGFFPKENEGFRRNGLGRRGARAEDSEAGGGRARRGGKTQHPRPRPSDLGSPRHPSELPTDHGSLRRPESKGNVQNSRSNQQKFHGSGASLQGRLDDPRSLYHYTVALSEPPPFSINHVKGMEAQTWWLTLAFATDKGVIPEPTIQPSATEDDESEEGRHEMLPEQTQAIQQESRLSEYESQTSNPALQIQIPEQMSSVMRPPMSLLESLKNNTKI